MIGASFLIFFSACMILLNSRFCHLFLQKKLWPVFMLVDLFCITG